MFALVLQAGKSRRKKATTPVVAYANPFFLLLIQVYRGGIGEMADFFTGEKLSFQFRNEWF
jgi:hypothetical protein